MAAKTPAFMPVRIAIASALVFAFSGCATTGFIVAQWDSGIESPAQTRCERLDFKSRSAMQEAFARYNGWKMVYLAQPDINAMHFDGLVCFERNAGAPVATPEITRDDTKPAEARPPADDTPPASAPRQPVGSTPTF